MPVRPDASMLRLLATLAVALPGGAMAQWLHLPLPWMIGPLLVVAALRIAGQPLAALPGGRQAGQWAIGAALGLYFTPAVIHELMRHGGVVLAIAAASLPIGVLGALLIRRLSGADAPTSFFAALPGGAGEMSVLAERHGGAVDRVAAAHALRVAVVVVTIPFALSFGGAHGSDAYAPLAAATDWSRMPLLVLASLLGAAPLLLLRVANAWVLGPLLGVGLLTATGMPLSSLPPWLVNGGQLLIGVALGCRFSPGFFSRAPRFIAAALMSALLAIVLGTSLALLFAWQGGLSPASMALAAAPGGVAEMSVTARELHLGVPLVTACHVLRVVFLTLGAGLLFRLVQPSASRQTA
ncbi:MAG: AbrB family transcriptional regulator [Rhodocyclaceae bacterium]|nr:AbrB family transcriptional regulator [Rhodocyclaceae bacterium]